MSGLLALSGLLPLAALMGLAGQALGLAPALLAVHVAGAVAVVALARRERPARP
jgi:hypothetical protein